MRFAALCALLAFASPLSAAPLNVITDIPPVQSLVAQVMGDHAEPDLLLSRGTDPHSFQLRPSQARAIAGADLVVWIGPELTPWLQRALDGVGADVDGLALMQDPVTRLRAPDSQEADAEPQTHVWLDPENAIAWLPVIADRLAAADPEHAADFAANAKAAAERIGALTNDLQAELAPVRDRPIVVLHDAYGYFADRFGVSIAGSLREGDAASPGAGRVADLRDLIVAQDIACVFAEPQQSRALLETLVEGTDARMAELDPTGGTLATGPALYDAMLRKMTAEITGCLGAAQ